MRSSTAFQKFCLHALAILYFSAGQYAMGAAKESAPERGTNVTNANRLEGTATVTTKDGKSKPVKATLRRWVIPGKQRAELDEHGFLLVQLRGGKVNVSIDGKEQKHVPGDFWVVPAKSRMSIQVLTETAGLDVLSLDLK